MRDLSVLVPARNEWLLGRTIADVLEKAQADTEVIAVLDGWTPGPGDTPIPRDPRVTVVAYDRVVGQRRATNKAARCSTARFVMKVDAHCAFEPGFDVKLLDPYDRGDLSQDTTSVPVTCKLRAWEWVCAACGRRSSQGPTLSACPTCLGAGHRREITWQPKPAQRADYGRFDPQMQFKYWLEWGKRPQAQGPFVDLMCLGGGCWLMPRARYWFLGGLDEAHGGWGQMGVEVACKSWLSGGRQVVNRQVWYAHMFRTQGDFSFPYTLRGSDVDRAKAYSRALWLNDRWTGAVRPLSWLVNHFAPVPEWSDAPVTKGH